MIPAVPCISYPCKVCHLETGKPFVQSTRVKGDNTGHKIHAAWFHQECIEKRTQQSPEASCPLCSGRITHVNGVERGYFLILPPEQEACSISDSDYSFLQGLIRRRLHPKFTFPSADVLAALEKDTRAIILRELASNRIKDRHFRTLRALAGAALGRLAVIEDFLFPESNDVRVRPMLYLCTIERLKWDTSLFNTFFPEDSGAKIAAVPDVTSATILLDHIASSVFKALDESLRSIPYTDADRETARSLAPALPNSFSGSGAERSFSELFLEASRPPPYKVAAPDAPPFKSVRLFVSAARGFAGSFPYAVVRALGAAAFPRLRHNPSFVYNPPKIN